MLAILLFLQDPADLIARLGHEDPDVREAATAALIGFGRPAADLVRPYLTSDDPEVSARTWIVFNAVWSYASPQEVLEALEAASAARMMMQDFHGLGSDVINNPAAQPFNIFDPSPGHVELHIKAFLSEPVTFDDLELDPDVNY